MKPGSAYFESSVVVVRLESSDCLESSEPRLSVEDRFSCRAWSSSASCRRRSSTSGSSCGGSERFSSAPSSVDDGGGRCPAPRAGGARLSESKRASSQGDRILRMASHARIGPSSRPRGCAERFHDGPPGPGRGFTRQTQLVTGIFPAGHEVADRCKVRPL